MKFNCKKCGHLNEVNAAAALGRMTSEAKRIAARQNAKMPPKPGSRPRGNPGNWSEAQMDIIRKIVRDFDGKPTSAYEWNPEWERILLKDHTETALWAKIRRTKKPKPEMITPPLPPPPGSEKKPRTGSRRGSRGVGAPNANHLQ